MYNSLHTTHVHWLSVKNISIPEQKSNSKILISHIWKIHPKSVKITLFCDRIFCFTIEIIITDDQWTWGYHQSSFIVINIIFLKSEPLTRLGCRVMVKKLLEQNPQMKIADAPASQLCPGLVLKIGHGFSIWAKN